MKKLLKPITIVITFLITISVLTRPVITYAASDESKVKKQTLYFLSAIQNYNVSKISNSYQPSVRSGIKNVENKDMAKVVRKVQKKHFSYSIDNISVKGKKATVTASVVYYDLYDNVIETYKDLLIYLRKKNSYSLSDSYKKWATYLKNDYLYEIEDAFDPDELQEDYTVEDQLADFDDCYLTHTTLKINYIKIGSKWYVQKSNKKLYNISDCGTVSAMNYISKNPNKFLKYYILGK